MAFSAPHRIGDGGGRTEHGVGRQSSRRFLWPGPHATFPFRTALIESSHDGEFGPPMECLDRYLTDPAPRSPKQALREFWPFHVLISAALSTGRGRRRGWTSRSTSSAPRHRSSVLCADWTDLAAALAELPELQRSQPGISPGLALGHGACTIHVTRSDGHPRAIARVSLARSLAPSPPTHMPSRAGFKRHPPVSFSVEAELSSRSGQDAEAGASESAPGAILW